MSIVFLYRPFPILKFLFRSGLCFPGKKTLPTRHPASVNVIRLNTPERLISFPDIKKPRVSAMVIMATPETTPVKSAAFRLFLIAADPANIEAKKVTAELT